MNCKVDISRLHFPVTTLGPGRRIGIWLQGCSIRCHGCISADTWTQGRGTTTVDRVISAIVPWVSDADGFTISGGEPFDQPTALMELLREIRKLSNRSTLVFTGYAIEQLSGPLDQMSGLIDALITDPFELTAPQTLALRGSDNQRLHFLTHFGRKVFAAFDRQREEKDRTFDLMLDTDGTVWFAGIPRRNDFERLRYLMESDGHSVVTSEDGRGKPNRSPIKS